MNEEIITSSKYDVRIIKDTGYINILDFSKAVFGKDVDHSVNEKAYEDLDESVRYLAVIREEGMFVHPDIISSIAFVHMAYYGTKADKGKIYVLRLFDVCGHVLPLKND